MVTRTMERTEHWSDDDPGLLGESIGVENKKQADWFTGISADVLVQCD